MNVYGTIYFIICALREMYGFAENVHVAGDAGSTLGGYIKSPLWPGPVF